MMESGPRRRHRCLRRSLLSRMPTGAKATRLLALNPSLYHYQTDLTRDSGRQQ